MAQASGGGRYVGALQFKGAYDANANSPDLDTSPSGILQGDMYVVSVAGTFFTEAVDAGDALIAMQKDPAQLSHWAIVESNIGDATTTTKGKVELATDGEALADKVVQGDDSRLLKQHKLDATAAPTVDNDVDEGYAPGSLWIDLTNDEAYVCLDATDGAAVWTRLTLALAADGGTGSTEAVAGDDSRLLKQHKLDATAAPTVDDDSADGYAVGSLWFDVTNKTVYACVDATEGAAVWEISGGRKKRAVVTLSVFAETTAVSSGDGKRYWPVPAEFASWLLVAVQAHVFTASSSGAVTVQVHNETQAVDMLSTVLTIDVTELDSKDAATPAVIDTDHDDLANGDEIRIDVDGAGTGTEGLVVTLTFEEP